MTAPTSPEPQDIARLVAQAEARADELRGSAQVLSADPALRTFGLCAKCKGIVVPMQRASCAGHTRDASAEEEAAEARRAAREAQRSPEDRAARAAYECGLFHFWTDMLANTTTTPNPTQAVPKAAGRRGRPATTLDNTQVSRFLGESLRYVTSPAVESRIDDILTGALELASADDTRTRTLRRKVLRAILMNCDHLSVENIRQAVTGDRYAERTVRAYAEVARVASRGILGLMGRLHYCRTEREWRPIGEHVVALAEFIPPPTDDEEVPEREVKTVRQLETELDAAYAAGCRTAEDQGTPWSSATTRGLPSAAGAQTNAMNYGDQMDLIGAALEV